jgi:hypothetical protein
VQPAVSVLFFSLSILRLVRLYIHICTHIYIHINSHTHNFCHRVTRRHMVALHYCWVIILIWHWTTIRSCYWNNRSDVLLQVSQDSSRWHRDSARPDHCAALLPGRASVPWPCDTQPESVDPAAGPRRHRWQLRGRSLGRYTRRPWSSMWPCHSLLLPQLYNIAGFLFINFY